MAAPEYVPLRPTDDPRSYKSPPRRPGSWLADRPGEVVHDGQPRGELMGNQGPDQGYAFLLARQFEGKLHVAAGEHVADAVGGCIGVAMKRASLFGRAPVIHDLTVAFTIWGFLDPEPDPELVNLRRPLFAEVRSPYHYAHQRVIVDAVPTDTLRTPHTKVTEEHAKSWRSLLGAAPVASSQP